MSKCETLKTLIFVSASPFSGKSKLFEKMKEIRKELPRPYDDDRFYENFYRIGSVLIVDWDDPAYHAFECLDPKVIKHLLGSLANEYGLETAIIFGHCRSYADCVCISVDTPSNDGRNTDHEYALRRKVLDDYREHEFNDDYRTMMTHHLGQHIYSKYSSRVWDYGALNYVCELIDECFSPVEIIQRY